MADPTTTHYLLNLPQTTDSMANVANSFNNAWPLITNAPKPKAVVAGSVLPTASYQPGQVIYLQGWKSNFICIGSDPNWGLIWRPIHAKWSPWVSLTLVQLMSDTTNWILATEGRPKYRISNTGEFEIQGAISRAASGTIPNGTITPFNQIPQCLLPDKTLQWSLAMHKSGMSSNNGNYNCKLYFIAPSWTIVVFNNATGTADATTLFFNGIIWQIAIRTDL